jgi:hypothetical protein
MRGYYAEHGEFGERGHSAGQIYEKPRLAGRVRVHLPACYPDTAGKMPAIAGSMPALPVTNLLFKPAVFC